MLLTEHFPELASWNVEIIGTDLSPTVLARAKAGRFSQLEVNRGLPAPYLIKYFTKEGDAWVIKDHLRRLTNFRPLNFIETWPLMPAFDLIFLRNVLIYFDVETKRSILKRVRACLLPHGTLFLGAAETTLNLDPGWTPTKYLNATVFHPIKTAAEARPA
jgi:chemotaxis protein methyltransferase CheR